MSFSPDQIATSPELMASLRLIRSEGIGPVSFFRLINKHGSAANVVSMLEAAAKKGTAKTSLIPIDEVSAELEKAHALGATYLFHEHDGYPTQLAELNDAPPILMARGNLNSLTKTMIAIVGARNCSAGGAKITEKICRQLADHGFSIVSGMARGIDTAAHHASKTQGTIACLAGGIDNIYPHENAALYEQIQNMGLIISEMPPGTQPQARHFPRRNRIISGLSIGIIVIEAAQKSGSLITARYAANQNRDVFVVPGSPLDPRAQGSNQLIRDGAVLVQSAQDIIDEYETMPLLRAPQKTEVIASVPPVAATDKETITKSAMRTSPQQSVTASDILTLLSPTPIHIDELVRRAGIPVETLLTTFTQLEVLGEITRHPGGKYSSFTTKNE